MSLIWLRKMLFLSLLFICSNLHYVYAEDTENNLESQVKSAYIFKFANYIKWPENSFETNSSPILIGVVNDEVIATEIEKIAKNHTAAMRPVIVKRLNSSEISPVVHILYLNHNSSKYLDFYKHLFELPPTLYITDTVEGLNNGGIINFVHDDDRIRFDISMAAAQKNNIKLEGSLLTVARSVLK